MGAYSVQLKYMLGAPGSPTVSMPMFFGFLGVTAVLLGIPIFVSVVFLQVTGWCVCVGGCEGVQRLMQQTPQRKDTQPDTGR
jgi:hypothetical protein